MDYLLNPDLKIIKPACPGNTMRDGRFLNYQKVRAPKLAEILRWQFSRKRQAKIKATDDFKLNTIQDSRLFQTGLTKLSWLGHASYLLTLNGKHILLDPVFANIPLVKRRAAIPFSIESYTPIDYILLSHAHYDHLDRQTLCGLTRLNPGAKIFCGLATANLLRQWGIQNLIVEAAWFQQYPQFGDGIEIYFMPALHWSNRTLRDRNRRLWGSFVIKTPTTGVYFMGDSGYAGHFREVAEYFPRLDYAILGVGAYAPRHIMESSHLNPAEAFQAWQDLGAKFMLPMHYATYDLTDETYSEPLRLTQEVFKNHADKLLVQDIGQIILL